MTGSSKKCSRCGKYPAHDGQHCPARDAAYRKCNKRGHFKAVCRAAKVGGIQEEALDSAFLRSVQDQNGTKRDPQCHSNSTPNQSTSQYIDTRVEVIMITEQMWRDLGQPTSDRVLKGPDAHCCVAVSQWHAQPVRLISQLNHYWIIQWKVTL